MHLSEPGRGAGAAPFRLAGLALLAASFLASGCAALVVGGAAKPGSYPAASRTAAQVAEDERISSLIEAAFRADKYLKSERASVSTQSGEVTLSGTVSTYQARSQAETLAAGVKGVRSVLNRLRVAKSY